MPTKFEEYYPFWVHMEKRMKELVEQGQFKNIPLLFNQEFDVRDSFAAQIENGAMTFEQYVVPRQDSQHGFNEKHDIDLEAWNSNNLIIYFTLIMLNEVIRGKRVEELEDEFAAIRDQVLLPLCDGINRAKHLKSSRPLGERDAIAEKFNANWEHIGKHYKMLQSGTVLPRIKKPDLNDSSIGKLNSSAKSKAITDHIIEEYAPQIKAQHDNCIRIVSFDSEAKLLILAQKNDLAVTSKEKPLLSPKSLNAAFSPTDKYALLSSGSAMVVAAAITFMVIALTAPAFPVTALVLVVLITAALGGGLGYAARYLAHLAKHSGASEEKTTAASVSSQGVRLVKAFGKARRVGSHSDSHQLDANSIPMNDLTTQTKKQFEATPPDTHSAFSDPGLTPPVFAPKSGMVL